MTSQPFHIDVAAYVLGVLDEDEVDAFENHLAQCRRCALDLRDFAELLEKRIADGKAGLADGEGFYTWNDDGEITGLSDFGGLAPQLTA